MIYLKTFASGVKELSLQRSNVTHLLVHMAGVLFYELGKAYVIWAQFGEPVQDAGLTGVKKRQVLGNLWGKQNVQHSH